FDGAKLYGLNTIALQTSNMEVVLKDSRVGINTSSPSKGRLHVASSMNDYINEGTYFSAGFVGLSPFGTGNHEISIYGERHILAGWGLLTESDARIKNIIGISDGTLDLETLSKVEVTDYTMIDDRQSGSSSFKKVIAQQVESVYPMAVSNTVGFIPDVYQLLNMENGAIKVKSDLEVGNRVKIFTNENKEVVATVKSKTKNKLIFDFQYSGKAFIYGKEVKNFKVVDYEALAMLNVSATQELYKIIQGQKEEIEMLKKQNDSLKASVENNSAELELIKMTLNLADHK
ncbi:MAG: tail fiber domain-containing protein, partial [Crocinitomicaceae bacterium]